MTKITKKDVMHLASLSRLSLSEEETEKLQTDLEAILGYIAKLSELNTKGVEPTYQVSALKNVWREDELTEKTVTSEALLVLAPEKLDNQIKVPKVL